jgi:hypothetical protein
LQGGGDAKDERDDDAQGDDRHPVPTLPGTDWTHRGHERNLRRIAVTEEAHHDGEKMAAIRHGGRTAEPAKSCADSAGDLALAPRCGLALGIAKRREERCT